MKIGKMTIDITDDKPVIIKRNGKIIYEDKIEVETLYQEHFDATWGTIAVLKRENNKDNSLELWVGGKFRYKLVGKDV